MNWAQFKDPVSHMCLTGAVVAFWSLTHPAGTSVISSYNSNFSSNFSMGIYEKKILYMRKYILKHK